MKNFYTALPLVAFLCIWTIIPVYSSGVLCTHNRSICTVGFYTLRGGKIYVKDGIMCTSNKRICTNGFSVLYSSGAYFADDEEDKKAEAAKAEQKKEEEKTETKKTMPQKKKTIKLIYGN